MLFLVFVVEQLVHEDFEFLVASDEASLGTSSVDTTAEPVESKDDCSCDREYNGTLHKYKKPSFVLR